MLTECLKFIYIRAYTYINEHLHCQRLEKFWAGKQITYELSVCHIGLGATCRGKVSYKRHKLSAIYWRFCNYVYLLKTSFSGYQSSKISEKFVSETQLCLLIFSFAPGKVDKHSYRLPTPHQQVQGWNPILPCVATYQRFHCQSWSRLMPVFIYALSPWLFCMLAWALPESRAPELL